MKPEDSAFIEAIKAEVEKMDHYMMERLATVLFYGPNGPPPHQNIPPRKKTLKERLSERYQKLSFKIRFRIYSLIDGWEFDPDHSDD